MRRRKKGALLYIPHSSFLIFKEDGDPAISLMYDDEGEGGYYAEAEGKDF
ncbi:hypothetical protein FACS1894151_10430 [Spirochaetia bacterium]|nr:hypothetical protein FACS1894151_10430 [Spirochaetia bacterium]